MFKRTMLWTLCLLVMFVALAEAQRPPRRTRQATKDSSDLYPAGTRVGRLPQVVIGDSIRGAVFETLTGEPKIHLILQMLKLDEEIKDFILKIDDTDPGLNFLFAYRLQPLFQVKSKERQRRKFWKMIEDQYPDQPTSYEQVALS